MLVNAFTRHAGIELPIIGGPMYPCSNPELVAAVSEAGGIRSVEPAGDVVRRFAEAAGAGS